MVEAGGPGPNHNWVAVAFCQFTEKAYVSMKSLYKIHLENILSSLCFFSQSKLKHFNPQGEYFCAALPYVNVWLKLNSGQGKIRRHVFLLYKKDIYDNGFLMPDSLRKLPQHSVVIFLVVKEAF